ncbi:MAG: tRNA lysidine(34) synthetase TilS [Spirochaetaceae bacterium]|jgi:tRNA(Ile)-lysidine synthase|nr:tRNA lysidine(34) synthetase TilS [Spirochaetaceae bacterium]
MTPFDSRLLAGFAAAGEAFRPGATLLAVSGGADSVALLASCAALRDRRHPAESLAVATVDHGIRPDGAGAADAAFVAVLCASLPRVECRVMTLGNGAVQDCAARRGRGIEDAARHLRYQALEEAARELGCPVVCLAHTRNDVLETILFRFLQGSEDAGGIPRRRTFTDGHGVFVRPLLGTSRAEVEAYLTARRIFWRTDVTNADGAYLRNRVRRDLIPKLDALFPGWDRAALSGAEKGADNAAVIGALADSLTWVRIGDGAACVQAKAFFALPRAVRRELIYRALALIDTHARFPYTLISRFIVGGEGNRHFMRVDTGEVALEKKYGRVWVRKVA